MASRDLFPVNDQGQTALHIAVGDGNTADCVQRASELLSEAAEHSHGGEEKLLWVSDNNHKTALHYACAAKNLELVQELFRGHSSAEPSHIVIPHGLVGRVHGLFETAMRDEDGHVTATSYSIAKELLSHSVGNPRHFFPDFSEYFDLPLPQTNQLEDAVPIVVLGDHNSGKSTFMKSLQINGALSNLYHFFVNVRNVDSYRAGIIPTHVESKSFGRVVFYELSGHREFVHEAILECGQLSDALFVVVVNLKDEFHLLQKQIRYWFNFIEYHHSKIVQENPRPPNVLVVGSHRDYFKLGRILAPHDRLLYAFRSVRSKFRFNFTNTLPPAMDCRKTSAHIVQLSWTMWYELQSLRTGRQPLPSQCYILYGALCELCTEENGHAITVHRLVQKMASSDSLHYKLLTPQTEWMVEKIRYLHDLNVVVFLEDMQRSGRSWVVTDSRLLLRNVEEAIIEPTESGNGVLSYSEVVELLQRFPNRNVELMVKLMLHFKYCSIIEDSRRLENHYFFPHLLENPSPRELRARVEFIKDDCCMFAWTSIPKKGQACRFFMPHLIHTLLLEVSKRFAPSDCGRMQHTVYWADATRGLQVVLHIPGNDAIVLNMKAVTSTHASTFECLKLRNAIIPYIRDLLERDGTTVTEEFFIPSSYPRTLFPVFDPIAEENVMLCSLENVTNAVKNKLAAIPSRRHISCFPVADVLLFEPYYSMPKDLLQELATTAADPDCSKGVLEQPFFTTFVECFREKHLKLLLSLLEVPDAILPYVDGADWIYHLYEYIQGNGITYTRLRQTLDSISFIKLHEFFQSV